MGSRPPGRGQSILHDDFPTGVQLLLATVDLHPDGVDVETVIDQLWARLSPLYRTDDLTALQLDGWRRAWPATSGAPSNSSPRPGC